MQRNSVELIVKALAAASTRYLIVGGLAVVAHGYVRLTADLDLILDFDENNLRGGLRALASLGYRPRAPVPIEDFADQAKRSAWIRDKGLKVFSLFSPSHPATEVDLFVEAPLDFEQAYARAEHLEVAPGLAATFIGFDDLVVLKERAGRPKDLEDIERLKEIRRQSG